MNDAPDAPAPSENEAIREYLEARSDDALRDLIAQGMAVLEQRAVARRRQAIAEIKRLAKENNLAVNVQKPARKRGRRARNPLTATTQGKESA